VSEWDEPEDPGRDTVFLKDNTRSIINYNDSPDVGFDASINPIADANMAASIVSRARITSISDFRLASISKRRSS